jgi:hypothetical protein
VEIVVPSGFTGRVWVIADPDAMDIPLVNGRYQVVIPPDGILRVSSLEPFEQWHQSFARFDDGTILADGYTGGPAIVALWGGASAVIQREDREVAWMEYFVGTEEQYGARPPEHLPLMPGDPYLIGR